MFDHRHYVPILKGKDGEFGALHELSKDAKSNMTPLIDVLRVPLDWEKGRPSKPLHEHLARISEQIRKSWLSNRPVFVDLYDTDPKARTSDGTHPMKYLTDRLRDAEVGAIPVTGLDRDDDYQKAVSESVSKDSRGVCVRVQGEDMEDFESLEVGLARLLKALRQKRMEVDLLLDFRETRSENLRLASDLAVSLLGELENVPDYRTVTVAASSFPGTLKEVEPQSIDSIPRVELELWQDILSAGKKLLRLPSFGDYGICHPDYPDLDPRTYTPSASIRYTLDEDWLIVKGATLKKLKYEQFHELSRALVARKEFYGPKFSWGDQKISECAKRRGGTGNLTTWRKIGTNHHLTLVAEQVKKLSARISV